MPKFLKPLILVVAAAASAATFGVSTAHASACSNALIHDWYVDGRIDKTYPVHCYREALKDIPEDQIVYGTLRDDLNRALENVIRDHNGNVTPMTPVPPSGGGGSSDGSSGGSSGTHDKGFFHWLAKKVGPDTANSVPVPLLVLGGLALALIAAAAISYGARRYQTRKAQSNPPPYPPDA
ncbi:MAG TPA: hypothetical protein VLB89_10335 [Gaiellaceae bacterium]|nr:hypothetical protein [Gaiellaceae bacterium]